MSARLTRRAAIAALGAAVACAAQAGAPPIAPAPRPRSAPTGAALAQARGFSGEVGFVLCDAATGATLEALNAGRGFAPASVVKLATALYALETLGRAHRFETATLARGALADGRLAGDLVLRGGGDPELDTAQLAQLAAETAQRVRGVTGRFLVEDAPAAALIDADQPAEASYNPAVGALNLNFNRVRLAWSRRGGALDARIEAHSERLSPPTAAVGLQIEGLDCGCPVFSHDASRAPERWRVRADALRGEGSVFLPVRAPALYAADVFRSAAAQAGLALPPPVVAAAGAGGGAPLAATRSRALDEIVGDMLRHSTNLTAEALGLAATRARGGDAASLEASGAAMSAWAEARAGAQGLALRNHSGLSAESRARPEALAALMRAPGAFETLAPLIRAYPLEGFEAAVVLAKTGTMDFARGLGGWLVGPSGRRMVFAIFSGDLPRRAASRGGPAQGARGWRNAALGFERALLGSWLTRFG
ncbi:MAG: D-alanyl-D-alanine carboxypeptidase/D-alanyl-D-alanine-endopeptidase [Rubrimonas sp.]|uniref:D-alanyl-D-alanine carboxypeptidase/D-alanyl-D-alanine-endopeptidase n=1 Tax=Rubrimonas sp. TaxID=2036015 RepID=UPI002FDE5599